MRLKSIQIENYKSFLLTETIFFAPHFNIIIGKNNSGKSTLLYAASMPNESKPHRSLVTAPEPDHPGLNSTSVFRLHAVYSVEEIKHLIRLHGQITLARNNDPPDKQFNDFVTLAEAGLVVRFTWQNGNISEQYLADMAFQSDRGMPITLDDQGTFRRQNEHQIRGVNSLLPNLLADRVSGDMFLFSAERLNISVHQTGIVDVLNSNADNLPQVLHYLASKNSTRFARFNKLVSTVFPEIQWVTAPLINTNHAEIFIWEIDPETERNDLAIPLQHSGTGISQVLAMLYIIVTSQNPRIILIDEPQSFLHPGAVQRLFEIFRDHPIHQYIVTTHSPNVISLSDFPNVLLVKKEGQVSTVSILDATSVNDMSLTLKEVGVRPSDVFGADNILWVEGPTEAEAFPIILKKIAKRNLLGTKIVPIVNTGDLEGRHAERVLEIYERLSAGYGYIPPALAFLLDREDKSPTLQADLKRRSNERVHFLPRRMFENYLLEPEAISTLVNGLDGFSEKTIPPEEISLWIGEQKWNEKYIDSPSEETDRTEEFWLDNVDGANLLEKLFKHLVPTYEYHKIHHGKELTLYIVEHMPEKLQGLSDWLMRFLTTDS